MVVILEPGSSASAIFEYRNTDQLVVGVMKRSTSPGPDQDTWDLNNRETVMLLKLSIVDDQLSKNPSGKTTAEIWTHLKSLHETSDKSRAFFLKNTLFSIVMDERTTLQAHLNRIQEIRDQLLAIGRKMEEEDIVVITLRSLPKSYEHFIETLNQSNRTRRVSLRQSPRQSPPFRGRLPLDSDSAELWQSPV